MPHRHQEAPHPPQHQLPEHHLLHHMMDPNSNSSSSSGGGVVTLSMPWWSTTTSSSLSSHCGSSTHAGSLASLIDDGDDGDSLMVRKRHPRPDLVWKDDLFTERVLPALNKMRKNRRFCDVILQIGKQELHAHRVVLAAASPYFMELFMCEEKLISKQEIQEGLFYELNGGFHKEALERLMDYAYTARLEVPADLVQNVYLAARKLKMGNVVAECERFLASHLDLTSCLELRASSVVNSNSLKSKKMANGNVDDKTSSKKTGHSQNGSLMNGSTATESVFSVTNGKAHQEPSDAADNHKLGEAGRAGCAAASVPSPTSSHSEAPSVVVAPEAFDLVDLVDKFIAENMERLQENRHLLSLPRLQIEVLHLSREDRDAALIQPLCELVLDWSQRQWLEDCNLTIDNLTKKRYMLFMAADNSLQDCEEIALGSAIDSEIIQNYKKDNQQHFLQNPNKQGKKQRRLIPLVKPAKPREMLYSRLINQDERNGETEDSEWKIIATHKLDDQSILAVASLDGHLATLSIMQRINKPICPGSLTQADLMAMERSVSTQSLFSESSSSLCKSRSPRMSRPDSVDRETCVPVASMSQARCAVGADCLQGKLLVCGGYDRGECLNYVELYDPEMNAWSCMSPMLCKRGRFDVTVVNDEMVFAVAGSNGQDDICSVEKYDVKLGKWIKMAPLPESLSNIGLCHLNGVLYCVGGTNGPTGTKHCFKFDLQQGKWERIAKLNTGRFQAAVATYQGKIWAVGGCDGWNPLGSVEIYDPASDTWRMGPCLALPRRGCGIAVRNGKLMVVGGSDGTHSLCTTEILEDGGWIQGPIMTTCRTNVGVAMVGNKLWAVGGFSGKSFLNSIEYLDPESDEWTSYIHWQLPSALTPSSLVEADLGGEPTPPSSSCVCTPAESPTQLLPDGLSESNSV